MGTSDLTAIVAAAVTAAGPIDPSASPKQMAAWQFRVAELAARIAVMAAPESDLGRLVGGIAGAKVFRGVIRSTVKDPNSNRVVVLIETGTAREYKYKIGGVEHVAPAGQEVMRTDFLSNPVAGSALARRARSLIGRKVSVWVEMEKTNDPNKPGVRVLRHIEDVDQSDVPAPTVPVTPAAAAPVTTVDGSVVSVLKDTAGDRAVILLHTGTTAAHEYVIDGTAYPAPAGQQGVSTLSLSLPEGLEVARRARVLLGHKVELTLDGSGLVVRVLDLGLSDVPVAVAAREAAAATR